MRKRVRTERRRYQTATQGDNLKSQIRTKYKRAAAKFEKALATAKWQCWIKFLENTKPNILFGKNFKFMLDLVNYRLSLEAIKIPHGSLTSRVDATITELINYSFSNEYCQKRDNTPYLRANNINFGQEEIERTLRKMNRGWEKWTEHEALMVFPFKLLRKYISNKCITI